MGPHRALLRVQLVGVLFLAAGCYGYRPVNLVPSPGASVRLVLVGATRIAVQPAASESVRARYDQVLEVSGTVEATSRDTVAIRLGELRTAAGPIAGSAHGVALVPLDRVSRVTERHLQAGRTLVGGAGVLLLATTVLVVVLIVTVAKAAGG